MLLVMVTSSTGQLHVPHWLRVVSTRELAPCAPKAAFQSIQQFCKTLPSISTRRAFFNSKRFLIVQCCPANVGSPTRQEYGFSSRLPRISTSATTVPLLGP